MTNRLGLKIQLVALFATFCCSFAATADFGSEGADGGVDAGGNGIFVQVPTSKKLVLWDLFVNNPAFSETQVGDQIRFQSTFYKPDVRGEWVDYRQFKSFQFLKSRLALWSHRAPNFIGLLNEGGFVDGAGALSYRVLLIATYLHIQLVDEIAVPNSFPKNDLKAFPSAYFEDHTAFAFMNMDLWNNAGLISQAAMLLHERMRGLQMGFYLSNEELQKFVYAILLLDPNQAPPSAFDDSHFSKSWIALHSSVRMNTVDTLLGSTIQANIRGSLFDCASAPNPKVCVQQVLKPFTNGNYPPADPVLMAIADTEVNEAINKHILGTRDPGPFQLVSKGSKNGPTPALPTTPYFANMYGVYTVTGCKDRSVLPLAMMKFCDYTELWVNPNQKTPSITMFSLRKNEGNGGMGFAMFGMYDRTNKNPYEKYTETGDTFASVVSDMPQMSAATSFEKLPDSSYVLKEHVVTKTGNPRADYDYEFEITLRKK